MGGGWWVASSILQKGCLHQSALSHVRPRFHARYGREVEMINPDWSRAADRTAWVNCDIPIEENRILERFGHTCLTYVLI